MPESLREKLRRERYESIDRVREKAGAEWTRLKSKLGRRRAAAEAYMKQKEEKKPKKMKKGAKRATERARATIQAADIPESKAEQLRQDVYALEHDTALGKRLRTARTTSPLGRSLYRRRAAARQYIHQYGSISARGRPQIKKGVSRGASQRMRELIEGMK